MGMEPFFDVEIRFCGDTYPHKSHSWEPYGEEGAIIWCNGVEGSEILVPDEPIIQDDNAVNPSESPQNDTPEQLFDLDAENPSEGEISPVSSGFDGVDDPRKKDFIDFAAEIVERGVETEQKGVDLDRTPRLNAIAMQYKEARDRLISDFRTNLDELTVNYLRLMFDLEEESGES